MSDFVFGLIDFAVRLVGVMLITVWAAQYTADRVVERISTINTRKDT